MSELQKSLDFSILWTYADAAHYLRIAEATLRDRVKRGGGPPRIKDGMSRQSPVRFRPDDIVAYAAALVIKPRKGKKRGRPRKNALQSQSCSLIDEGAK